MSKRSELVGHLGKLEAHRGECKVFREKLLARAQAQLDSITPVIDEMAEHLKQGKGGGVIGHRRYKTLLVERNRLESVVGRLKARLDGR